MIRLFEPYVSKSEIAAAVCTLKSKFWASGSGINKVKQFETNFSRFLGSKACVAVSSGSAALHLALTLFDLKNQEVLVPSLTFVSTVHSVINNEAKPIFVDIDSSKLCISIDDIKKKITKKTRAIIPVHFGGMPCDLKNLREISNEFKIPIIEDAAHACGASFNHKKIGTHSEIVCFSFHPVKNLAMPNGGAICLNKKKSSNVKKLKAGRWCGIEDRIGYSYDVKRIGWNYYMNELSAAIGLVQLKKLNKLNNIRKRIAKRYSTEINLDKKMPFDENCSYHLYWLIVKNRSVFMKKMKLKGIETGIHYNPIHKMTLYNKIAKKLPITEEISKNIVSIPLHPNLNDEEIDYIISSINKLV